MRKFMVKIKYTNRLKRTISALLLISALGLSIAAQTGGGDGISGQTVGSGGRASQTMGSGGFTGGLIGSGTATASPDSRSTIEFVWSWFEDVL